MRMTTTEYQPLLSMVFKIKFLRAMLSNMTGKDSERFMETCHKISIGTAEESDFNMLNYLYACYERKKHAAPLSKT